jgi:zinc transport system ATP-binding protein
MTAPPNTQNPEQAEADALVFDKVSFSYGPLPTLDDATFTVPRGEFVSVIGPNGGGKTTVLRLALGLLQPDAGEIHICGLPPRQARHRVGYTPQHSRHDLRFPVTVMDVVLTGRLDRHWIGPYSRADRDAAMTALGEVALEDLARRPFSALSGGQRQRVLIARALVGEPDLLLLDEPTANVDALAGNRLLDLLQELNQRMTIIMVSHDLGFVSSIVQRVICVSRVVAVHPTSDLVGDALQDVYGGDFRMVRHDHHYTGQGHSHG